MCFQKPILLRRRPTSRNLPPVILSEPKASRRIRFLYTGDYGSFGSGLRPPLRMTPGWARGHMVSLDFRSVDSIMYI